MKIRLVLELDLSTPGKARYSAELKNLERPDEVVPYETVRRAVRQVVADLDKKADASKLKPLEAKVGRGGWLDSLRAQVGSEDQSSLN
jgi:hypothetical protein